MDKTCTKCGETKDIQEFFNNKASKDGKRPDCKECRTYYNKKWQRENRDKQRVIFERYKRNNPETYKQSVKRWHKANPDYQRDWRRRNKGKTNAYKMKHRTARQQAMPVWARQDLIEIVYELCPEGYHVDHIIPIQSDVVCGLHTVENLQYLTASENASKTNTFDSDTYTDYLIGG